jgi:hypothetical protein
MAGIAEFLQGYAGAGALSTHRVFAPCARPRAPFARPAAGAGEPWGPVQIELLGGPSMLRILRTIRPGFSRGSQ